MSSGSDTIAAIATGPARGGIGVIRLSGPAALHAVQTVVEGLPPLPTARHAYLVRVREGGELLDEGLALHFPAPHSVTGEDVVELQLHGAPRLLSVVLQRLVAAPSVRRAEAGEFTRRAFLNGRIDLARAEAVADLVAADSEAAVRAAAAQLAGGVSARVKAVREPLLALHADLEACLEFPDEADESALDLPGRVRAARDEVEALVASAQRGALIRRGARVVLHGAPNAGKSTLFNRLVGEERALVDPEPGTTRDVLEARVEWRGLALTLVDTAGLREDAGRVEGLGIARAKAAVESADLAVLLLAPGEPVPSSGDAGVLVVRSKSDLGAVESPPSSLAVSGMTGAGVDALRAAILERLEAHVSEVAPASDRHLDAFVRSGAALKSAEEALTASTLEVVAGEVGLAISALGQVTGEDADRDLIDAIFARFCIGK